MAIINNLTKIGTTIGKGKANGDPLDAREVMDIADVLYDTVEEVNARKVIPAGGDAGNVLTKTADGLAWAAPTGGGSADLTDYYTKEEADAAFVPYQTWLDTEVTVSNELTAVKNDYAKKEDLDDYAKQADVDAALADKLEESDLADYYKKTEVDSLLEDKLEEDDLDDYYNKTEVDDAIEDALDDYAKKADLTAAEQGGSGKYIASIKETNGVITAVPGNIDSTYSATGENPVNGKAIAEALADLKADAVGGSGKIITSVKEVAGKIEATEADAVKKEATPTSGSVASYTIAGSGTKIEIPKGTASVEGCVKLTDTYSGTGVDAVSGKAVKAAIDALDAAKSGSNATTNANLTVKVEEEDGLIKAVEVTETLAQATRTNAATHTATAADVPKEAAKEGDMVVDTAPALTLTNMWGVVDGNVLDTAIQYAVDVAKVEAGKAVNNVPPPALKTIAGKDIKGTGDVELKGTDITYTNSNVSGVANVGGALDKAFTDIKTLTDDYVKKADATVAKVGASDTAPYKGIVAIKQTDGVIEPVDGILQVVDITVNNEKANTAAASGILSVTNGDEKTKTVFDIKSKTSIDSTKEYQQLPEKDLVSSQAVGKYVNDKLAELAGALIYKGTVSSTTALPTITDPEKATGWECVVSEDGTYDGKTCRKGDFLIYDGTGWNHVQSTTTIETPTVGFDKDHNTVATINGTEIKLNIAEAFKEGQDANENLKVKVVTEAGNVKDVTVTEVNASATTSMPSIANDPSRNATSVADDGNQYGATNYKKVTSYTQITLTNEDGLVTGNMLKNLLDEYVAKAIAEERRARPFTQAVHTPDHGIGLVSDGTAGTFGIKVFHTDDDPTENSANFMTSGAIFDQHYAKIWKGTQETYDALDAAGDIDDDTLYLITEPLG